MRINIQELEDRGFVVEIDPKKKFIEIHSRRSRPWDEVDAMLKEFELGPMFRSDLAEKIHEYQILEVLMDK